MDTHTTTVRSLLIILFFALNSCETKSPRPLEILFLGHNSIHHNSEKLMPFLASALTKKGINLTYTARPEDINPENLSFYDGLMIYANHDSITTSQEKALLEFVAGGKGFLPIHCASWCFRNSDEYVKLVGGQFKSHGTGTFSPQVVNSEHPITDGFETFEAWDETYVHDKLNPDRVVLMERVQGDQREPWTWVRDYGKGRVFYTASGHDERTWTHPGFHDLIVRGITWAVDEDVKKLWEQLDFPDHQYTPSENIANYEKRSAPLPMQAPFKQPESQKFIQVPPEFNLEVYATEPDIINPIFITWDQRGRLWVIETVDYPNEVKPTSEGVDRIKICEDTDGDGRADKFTVFADGLNIPTSLVFANDGVIVSMAPDFLFLKDTDGDDHADIKETLISGWGTYDTHAGPSNLKYGFDNYIWGTVGYSAFKGTVAGKDFEFGQGLYRLKPDATDFEFVTPTSNNTWGLGFSETFDVFASTANNAHSWYMAIPERHFGNVKGIGNIGSKKIADYYTYHPITLNYRQVDVFGGFTAAAGHNLYTARAFPRQYWNRVAFISEPTGHLLAKGALEKQGAGFALMDEWNFLASSDEWVSPVHAEVGPDGAVWVADWYNFIIQHNPTPTPERGGYAAETGRGNAHINPLRDRARGRIYRVAYKNAPSYTPIELSHDDPDGLVDALESDNLFWRMTAQRMLVERGDQDVVDDLIRLIDNTQTDEIGINGGAIHSLWTLHGLGALSGNNEKINRTVASALRHPSAGVRKAAIQVSPRTFEFRQALMDANVLQDIDPHTQLVALLAISEMPYDEEVGMLLYEVSQDDGLARDLWRSQALFIAANSHKRGFLASFEDDTEAIDYQVPTPTPKKVIPRIWEQWDNPESIVSDWPEMNAGEPWEDDALPEFDGRVLMYQAFELEELPTSARLNLGRIGQSDYSLVNGTMLHETRNDPEKLRVYEVPIKVLQRGSNYIILRVEDEKGPGGLLGPLTEMFFTFDDKQIPLGPVWKYYVQIRKSRGINSSEIGSGRELAARFAAYNSKEEHGGDTARKAFAPAAGTTRIVLGVTKNQMQFDHKEIVVPAGMQVEINFQNTDFLQHNLVIIVPGSLERVGKEADRMAQAPDGQEKQYIPEIPEVLFASRLLDPGKTAVIKFKAPQEPGDYPFVCTFPGHWMTMNGILKVVP